MMYAEGRDLDVIYIVTNTEAKEENPYAPGAAAQEHREFIYRRNNEIAGGTEQTVVGRNNEGRTLSNERTGSTDWITNNYKRDETSVGYCI